MRNTRFAGRRGRHWLLLLRASTVCWLFATAWGPLHGGAGGVAMAAPGDVIESGSGQGRIDWTRGLIIEVGAAAGDMRAPSPAVARVTAERRARQQARARLLRRAQELTIGDQDVAAWARDDQAIAARLAWAVNRARDVAVDFSSDGSVVVTAALPLEAVRLAVHGVPVYSWNGTATGPSLRQPPGPTSAQASGQASGQASDQAASQPLKPKASAKAGATSTARAGATSSPPGKAPTAIVVDARRVLAKPVLGLVVTSADGGEYAGPVVFYRRRPAALRDSRGGRRALRTPALAATADRLSVALSGDLLAAAKAAHALVIVIISES